MTAQKICIVLVNYNGADDTIDCVRSINGQDYVDSEVIVVDNDSQDNSVRRIREACPDVSLLTQEANLGFPGGNNVGIETALKKDADYVFLLNNDTILKDEDTLTSLVETMETHPNIGILSPAILEYPEGTPWFLRGKLTDSGWRHSRQYSNLSDDTLIDSDWITGCAMCVRSTVFQNIGLLDESFFLIGSDIDFSMRARRKGYDLCVDPSIEIYHKVSSSIGKFGYSYYTSRNKLRLIREYDQFSWTAIVSYLWWVTKAVGERVLHGQFNEGVQVLNGVKDGILGVTGKK